VVYEHGVGTRSSALPIVMVAPHRPSAASLTLMSRPPMLLTVNAGGGSSSLNASTLLYAHLVGASTGSSSVVLRVPLQALDLVRISGVNGGLWFRSFELLGHLLEAEFLRDTFDFCLL
jgi:hypothetical protein